MTRSETNPTHRDPDVRVPHRVRDDVRDVARQQTNPSSTPRISRLDLVGKAAFLGHDPDLVSLAVDQLVTAGDLLRYEYNDREWLTVNNINRIRRWIVCEAQTEEPDQNLIGALNRQLATLKSDQ